MKLKTRIIVGFVAIILLPLLLFSASLYGFSQTQAKHVQESSSQASDSNQMIYDISLAQSSSSQVKLMAKDMILTATIILVFTALSVGLWIYRSIAVPMVKLKKATQNIKEGNLDFVLEELRKGRGTQFDPRLVDIMLGLLEDGTIDVEGLYGASENKIS